MKDFKVNYTPLILWAVLLVPVMLSASYLLEALLGEAWVLRGVLLVISVYLNALFALMERCDAAYWLSGSDWEQLKAAGAARRKAFVRAHAKPFAMGMAAFALWCTVSACFGAPKAADIVAFFLSVLIPTFSCFRIKL